MIADGTTLAYSDNTCPQCGKDTEELSSWEGILGLFRYAVAGNALEQLNISLEEEKDGQKTDEKTAWQMLSHPDAWNLTLKCISTLHPYFYVKLFDKKHLKLQYFS